MKLVIIFALVCAVYAAPKPQEADIVRSAQDVRPDGYTFGFELTDQTKRDEQGEVVEEENKVNGESSWVTPEGKKVTLKFNADATGYHPTITIE